MAKKTKAEEEYADLVIQSLVQEDYSVSKPVESAATSNESQDMEDKGDAQEADGAKVDKKSTSTEKNVAIATPQVPQNRKNKTKDIAVNKECIVKRDYEESFMRESGMTARKGKQVCIRSNFHDRIMKLIQVIGKNEVTIASYIDMCWHLISRTIKRILPSLSASISRHSLTYKNKRHETDKEELW